MAFISSNRIEAQARERRASPRRRVAFGSWLASLDGSMVLACETRDVSALGVRVHPKQAQILPKTLLYLDVKDRMAYQAAVRWQDKTEAGLEFSKAWRFADLADPQMQKVVQSIVA